MMLLLISTIIYSYSSYDDNKKSDGRNKKETNEISQYDKDYFNELESDESGMLERLYYDNNKHRQYSRNKSEQYNNDNDDDDANDSVLEKNKNKFT